MTACGAVGALVVGGRVVGQLRCTLPAGHDEARLGGIFGREQIPATPHEARLTWTPEAEPDLDLFDPDERFDVDVEL